MNWIKISLFLALSPVFSTYAGEFQSQETEVQKAAKIIYDATFSSDIETTLRHTHPKAIEIMGGTENAKLLLKESAKEIESLGVKLVKLEFPSEPSFFESDYHYFVFVPTSMTIETNIGRGDSRDYLFGVKNISEKDRRWLFIQGSSINSSNVNLLFPDFPKDAIFPAHYKIKSESNQVDPTVKPPVEIGKVQGAVGHP